MEFLETSSPTTFVIEEELDASALTSFGSPLNLIELAPVAFAFILSNAKTLALDAPDALILVFEEFNL